MVAHLDKHQFLVTSRSSLKKIIDSESEAERERETLVGLLFHLYSLILVHAPTGGQTCNLGVLGRCSRTS